MPIRRVIAVIRSRPIAMPSQRSSPKLGAVTTIFTLRSDHSRLDQEALEPSQHRMGGSIVVSD